MTAWRTALRTVFLLPMTLSSVVVGIAWRALLTPEFGWGKPDARLHVGWLGSPDLALFTLVVIDAWQWTPLTFVILLAGLLGLPPDGAMGQYCRGSHHRLGADHAILGPRPAILVRGLTAGALK